ncbi:hypothetical protein PIB30_011439 [Stylosanthes scabra]|uniref:Uncharacterized protein n=1 Tax=Stylosanthes scabra TaxID=79078 RepID=A0ABU6Q6L5_9FABA|nr:hypothetical protein [Stylosanthes scabra]
MEARESYKDKATANNKTNTTSKTKQATNNYFKRNTKTTPVTKEGQSKPKPRSKETPIPTRAWLDADTTRLEEDATSRTRLTATENGEGGDRRGRTVVVGAFEVLAASQFSHLGARVLVVMGKNRRTKKSGGSRAVFPTEPTPVLTGTSLPAPTPFIHGYPPPPPRVLNGYPRSPPSRIKSAGIRGCG